MGGKCVGGFFQPIFFAATYLHRRLLIVAAGLSGRALLQGRTNRR
jgi:hypothetical protein